MRLGQGGANSPMQRSLTLISRNANFEIISISVGLFYFIEESRLKKDVFLSYSNKKNDRILYGFFTLR